MSYQTELSTHYQNVKNRLWKPKLPTRHRFPTEPELAALALPRPFVSLAGAILTLNDVSEPEYVKLAVLMQAVVAVTGIPRADIVSCRQTRPIVRARHLFVWFAMRYSRFGSPYIGKYCNRDHSTCLHGVAKINASLASYQDEINAIKSLCLPST